MKYMKSYILFALMGWAVTSCTLNDLKDDVDNLKDRVTLIEQQVKLLNDNLAVAGFVLDPQNKLITDVKEKDGQFVIELTNGDKLNLTIGKPGTVNEPVITIEDGYWVINGVKTNVKAAGENGKNGEGFPEFRVEAGKWQVRFGEGAWTDVQGGTIEGITGSLGDQIFESAKVEGKNFVVTLKDGNKVITLPIVEKLACAIDETGLELAKGGYLELEAGTRTIIPVKVNGDEVQVTYPQGWRAAVTPMAAADEKGNNYQLAIFAPNAEPKVSVRANAESAADVCVLVQKGNFWAIDKIKVRLKEEAVVAKTDLEKYNAGQSIVIGGLEISKKLYGEAVEVKADQAIDKGGVYFVSKDGAKLTCSLVDVKNLIILPTSADVKTIELTISKTLSVTGTAVCSNVILTNETNGYPLSVGAANVNILFDSCKFMNLHSTQGLISQPDGNKNVDKYSLDSFTMIGSDVRIDEAGINLYLINNMNCTNLIFSNNILYYSGIPAESKNVQNFKVFNGKDRSIDNLVITNNTYIDLESSYTGNNLGLFYVKSIQTAKVDDNIYYFSDYRQFTAFLLRVQIPAGLQLAAPQNNYAYNFKEGLNFNLFQNKVDNKTIPFTSNTIDVFADRTQATFDKANGVFIPMAEYKTYGAQR